MNKTNLGQMIKKLRQKHGYTQTALAERLGVSDKAISKWESGGGYPDITQLPALSELFGVTIDYLLKGHARGITIAGNILVDILNTIEHYPKPSMLENVLDIDKSVGGCVPNTIINLAKIDPEIFLSAIGKIGNDENGRYVLAQMHKHGIDTSKIKVSDTLSTSFTNVMYDLSTGERTFFYNKGANLDFGLDDIDIDTLDSEFLHIGYAFLLPALDEKDDEYGTKLAHLLSMASKKGIKTSIDAVSTAREDYADKIIPVLKYCSYTIMNETESSLVTGIEPRHSDGRLNEENIKNMLKRFIEYGVRDKVILHAKEAGFMMDSDGKYYCVPSLILPEGYIAGNVGAGDAFAAGCLWALYNGYEDEKILEFASAASAANLASVDAIGGMLPAEKLWELTKKFKRRSLN
jgi:sugar/nucleoside kinase (ribokinase family)/DNA-binding XRE family transcriptional regulator